MDWQSKDLEACFQISPWLALALGQFPFPKEQERRFGSYHTLAVLTTMEPKVHSSTRDVLWVQIFYGLHGNSDIPCDHISNMMAVYRRMGSLGKYIFSWVTATESPLVAQLLLTQRFIFSRYKTMSQHLLSLLSAAVSTDLKVCKSWPLEWEAASLARCAEGSRALQRTAVHSDAKPLA